MISISRMALLGWLFAGTLFAQENRVDLPQQRAIEKGLEFLSRTQKPDGSFGDEPNRIATTGMSVLAYIAAGHAPGAGRDGEVVRKAIDYLVSRVPADGYVGKVDNSRMYGQGIVTLALAEACGAEVDHDRRVKMVESLEKLVKVILDAQDVKKPPQFAGGWRYEPSAGDADLSLSGWNALALRACQNVGVTVPKDRAARAAKYVIGCFNARDGGYEYQPGRGAAISMTSVAILNLYLLGDDESSKQLTSAKKWLGAHLVNEQTPFPYYSLYYSTQAANQVGGDVQKTVWANNFKLILSRQQKDGGFSPSPSGEEPGRIYATAICLMTLAVPNQMLPIYQK